MAPLFSTLSAPLTSLPHHEKNATFAAALKSRMVFQMFLDSNLGNVEIIIINNDFWFFGDFGAI